MSLQNRTLHVIGDSHTAIYSGISDGRSFQIPIRVQSKTTTMRSVDFGVDFDLSVLKAKDIVLFVFGEVDVRYHIGQQLEEKRDMNEVVDSLVKEYCEKIRECTVEKGVFVLIAIPLSSGWLSQDATDGTPCVGPLSQRLKIWTAVVKKLLELVPGYGFSLFDPTTPFTMPGAYLDHNTLDQSGVHIREEFAPIMRCSLLRFLNQIGQIVPTVRDQDSVIEYRLREIL